MSEKTPAGWYDDPSMVNTRRYWDGQKWTEHRQESAQPAPPGPAPTPAQRAGARAWWDNLWVRIPVAIVLILVAAALISRGGEFLGSLG